MSINSDSCEVNIEDRLLPRQNTDYRNVNSRSDRTMRQKWNPEDGPMSPARRTFCLFTTFDLILTFILWVIYTQLVGYTPIWNAFQDQVFNYTFYRSLFDTVMISAARFTFIMLAYALFRISHWWVIAVSTSMTCVYLLCKCFLFEFSDRFFGGKNPLSYIILIVCFVLAWIETWMLDFKVIPTEKKLMEDTEREPLLSSRRAASSLEDTREYYSPFHTPQGSDDEGEINSHYTHNSHHHSGHSRKASDASLYSVQSSADTENYMKLVEEAKNGMMEMLSLDGWKLETGKALEDGIVYSLYIKKYKKKIFKFMGIVNLPAKTLWHEMIMTLNDSPKWNPTILESRTLQNIDDQTEITYNISAEAAGGLVSARDFVSVRHFTHLEDETYISCGTGCTHHDMPVQKKYVRGENGPGGWIFQPVDGDPNRCIFTWIVNSNLKGWLPQAVIDQALSGVMLQYFNLLRKEYERDTS